MKQQDNVTYFFREFSKYALTSKIVKHKLGMEDGSGRCYSCGKVEHRSNLYLFTRNHKTFPSSKEDLVNYLLDLGDMQGLHAICKSCCGEYNSDLDSVCSVYWIRLPIHTDILSEGYIGITSYYRGRLASHMHEARNNLKKNKEFEQALNDGNYIASEILIGTRSYCLMIENKLRPEWNIGWNKCIGGEDTTFVHGMTSHPLFYIMQGFLYNARKRGAYISDDLNTIEGRRDFLDYLSSLEGDGNFTLINRSAGVYKGNIERLPFKECQRKRLKKYQVNGEMLSIPELSERYNIKQNTLIYRLRRGESILEAIRVEEKKQKTVKVNGKDVRYNGVLSQHQIDEIVSAFLSGETRNRIAVRMGIPPRPVYTILEKGGLNGAVGSVS